MKKVKVAIQNVGNLIFLLAHINCANKFKYVLMRLRNILLSTVLTLAMWSCSKIKGEYAIIDRFPTELTVPFSGVFEDEIGILSLQNAGRYIVGTRYKSDHFFTIYDINQNKIVDICRHGNGPNEFLAPAYYEQYEVVEGEVKIWVHERPTSKFILINIDKTIETGLPVIDKSFDLSGIKPQITFRNIYYIDDNLLVGTTDLDDCKLFSFNPNNGSINIHDHLLPFPNNYDVHEIAQNMTCLKPDKSSLASVFFNLPQMDIYGFPLKREISIFNNRIIYPKDIFNNSDEIDDCFSCVCSSNFRIYALSTQYNKESDEILESNVFVYDWDGNPLAKLKLPPTTYITIDETSKQMLAVNFDDGIVNLCILPDF